MCTRNLGLVSFFVVLFGCGGSSGDSGSSSPPPPPPPPQSASGIWLGVVSQQGLQNDTDCLVTEAGELACILFDSSNGQFAGAVRGTVQVSNGNELSGSGTSYAAPGYVLADGSSVVGNFSITGGTVSSRNTIDLTFDSVGQPGTFSASFDPLYDRGSSIATVEGVYTAFDIFGDPASFSIDSAGQIFSQTQSGCVGNGQVTVIDSQFNSYEVEATVSNCPGLNGDYAGLAITTDYASTNDVFLFGIFSGQAAIIGAPLK